MSESAGAFDRLLDAAASAAPSVALELEANGLQWTPKVVAAVIGCVLAKSWNDENRRAEWTSLLLPYVEKHLRRPSE